MIINTRRAARTTLKMTLSTVAAGCLIGGCGGGGGGSGSSGVIAPPQPIDIASSFYSTELQQGAASMIRYPATGPSNGTSNTVVIGIDRDNTNQVTACGTVAVNDPTRKYVRMIRIGTWSATSSTSDNRQDRTNDFAVAVENDIDTPNFVIDSAADIKGKILTLPPAQQTLVIAIGTNPNRLLPGYGFIKAACASAFPGQTGNQNETWIAPEAPTVAWTAFVSIFAVNLLQARPFSQPVRVARGGTAYGNSAAAL